jgi:prevent-host-death family protein
MAKRVSASDAKNNFGGLLEDVAALGRVDIIKHGRLVAVMLSPRALSPALPADEVAEQGGTWGDRSAAEEIPRSAAGATWGKKHMIPPENARGARMVGVPSTFDEE